jgi:hypothetical protein
MKTPDEEVAERVLSELRKMKLLSEMGITKIGQGLAAGKLTAEDWRLAFAADRKGKEDKDATEG